MTVQVPDRFRAANAFWIGLAKIGLTPAAVLTQARVPVTVYDGKKNLVTTAQFFALWRAVGALSSDPAAGLKIATQISVGDRPPSTMAAFHSRDYRDALSRLARFKQLCTPEELQIKMSKDECLIEPVWTHAKEETPPLLTDAAFASFVELGRRGTGHPLNAKRVELKRSAEATGVHEAYFKCPVKFGARRNLLVLHAADLDRPFVRHNAELLEMLDPQLVKAVKEQRAQRSTSEQVKWVLKRLLAGARPEIAAVARELGLSDRTLQRRIVDDGTTFRQLPLDERAKLIFYNAFIDGALDAPRSLLQEVHRLYFEPGYPEFSARTMWSLSNAFTSAFKKLDPIPQFKATAKLGGSLAQLPA